jgi:hypothetical protein
VTEEIDDPIQLQAGDALLCADGTAAAEVSGVENLKGACDVFNFSVDETACYFAGGVLVHNTTGFYFSSMEGAETGEFAESAPDWRGLGAGMAIEAKCQTAGCEASGKFVVCNLGFTTFDVGSDFHDDVQCPICKKTPSEENNTILFSRCKYSFKGHREDGTKKEQAPKDTGPGGFQKMPGGSGGEGAVRWRALQITAAPR